MRFARVKTHEDTRLFGSARVGTLASAHTAHTYILLAGIETLGL